MTISAASINRNLPGWNSLKISTIVYIVIFCFSLSACVAAPAQTSNNPESAINSQVAAPINEPLYDKWSKHDIQAIKDNKKNRPEATIRPTTYSKKIDLKSRMLLKDVGNTQPIEQIGKTYSFTAKDMDLRDALNQFAHKYKLQIIVDQEVEGDAFVNFKDQPLDKAIELILGAHRYYWHWDNGILKVSRLQTKTFVLDYLRLVRSNNASNSSTNSDETRKDAMGAPNSSTIEQSDNVAFWQELEGQLDSFVSDDGRLVINRLSGTIQYTDIPSRITEVESFLESLQSALHRQVVIDARIMEVSLRDDAALGIDWKKISVKNLVTGAISTITPNIPSFGVKANTINIESFEGLLAALEEQGNVRIVSQPRIRTMNNQPSLIKVGTDKTFFTKSTTLRLNVPGNTDEVITEKPKIVTEGLVLSLTPQISKDRWVMLDISPVITRIVDTTVSAEGSTAPVLDIKQASTLVRARDGEMIILGGLIQDDEIKTERRVPLLSEIPWIGNLFKGHYTSKIKKELVIFLVPRIVI